MAIDPARVKSLFQAAIELTDPDERRAFLDREAGGDAELHGRLDALLTALEQSPGALDRPPGDDSPTMTAARPVESRGPHPNSPGQTPSSTEASEPTRDHRGGGAPALLDTIIAGRYRLRQLIGEGGMGSVYLADQTQPVRRRVALKLVRPGMDSRAVLARFESERQALALMDHPNIARVLDAGTTEHGRPFFVMELVKGVPLTEYCDQHRLDIPARLEVFRQVCSAVQHAHQKGIIHRDLKPTNILVEAHDGRPVPKVIDFGLAKATSGLRLSEDSLFTAFGSITGTPLYMAPEQAAFNALDVDTRADIYALGVILYELLTGSTPIDRGTLGRAALDEMLRVIREVEPPTPSSRLGTSASLPSVAAARLVEPVRLSRLVRGDLDWIVMKALAKERDRRYDSAIGLANDVERYLNDEPVTAGPPTARYRTVKFIRRHRGQVVAASLVVLALIGGTIGTTLGLFEARRQRDLARAETAEKERARAAEADQRLKAETARHNEARSRQMAERRSDQLGKVNDLLGSIFRDLNLSQADKDSKPVAATLGEWLDQASAALEGESTGDPLTVARMQMALGQAQFWQGNLPKAIELLERSRATFAQQLGPDHPDTLVSMYSLMNPYSLSGKFDQAITLIEQILEVRRAKLGPDHPDTLNSISLLAFAYADAGLLDRAIPLFEQTLEASGAKLGPDHRYTLSNMAGLAEALRKVGYLDQAVSLHERVTEGYRARQGPDHVWTFDSMEKLAGACREAGRLDRAIPLQEQVLDWCIAKLGPNHPGTFDSMEKLARAYKDVGQLDRAITLQEQATEGLKAKLGSDHLWTLRGMGQQATTYRDAGRLDQAITLHGHTLEAAKAKLGPDHPQTLEALTNLAEDYRFAGRHDRAEVLFEQVLARRRAKIGPNQPDTLRSMADLAGAYADTGKIDRAVALDRECLEACQRGYRFDSPIMALVQDRVGSRLLRREKWGEAEPMLRASLATRQAKLAENWRTFDTQSLLGGALLGQGRIDEARPLLVAGLEGMRRRLATIPAPDRGEAVAAADRLVRLAEVTNNPDEARRWREEKARLEVQSKPPSSTGATPPNVEGARPTPVDPKPAAPVESRPALLAPAGGEP